MGDVLLKFLGVIALFMGAGVIGYFYMTTVWGMTMKSWPLFFVFTVISAFYTMFMGACLKPSK